MNLRVQHYKNRVLASLPKAEISRLERHVSPVALPQNLTCQTATVRMATSWKRESPRLWSLWTTETLSRSA